MSLVADADCHEWDDVEVDKEDCCLTGGLVWVHMEGGGFAMGCAEGDGGCELGGSELAHWVSLPEFEMLETEVTEGQFRSEMGELVGQGNGLNGGCADCPVVGVTFWDASNFCQRVGGRLPTEAEWEYAARCGTSTIYECGDSSDCLDDIAWFDCLAVCIKHKVKSKSANACGLYDMTGNAGEWVGDWYASDYYSVSPEVDPGGPEEGTQRVVRGGSFRCPAFFLRVSYRGRLEPSTYSDDLGFRCCKSSGD